MPSFKSKNEVTSKLTKARQKLRDERAKKPRDEKKVAAALKECTDLQYVLDSWDALHS